MNIEDYIFEIGLNKLKQKTNGRWNAECPLCDDAEVKQHRLWFTPTEKGCLVKCYNCGCRADSGMGLGSFLYLVNRSLWKKFTKEQKVDKFDEIVKNRGRLSNSFTVIKSFENVKFAKCLNPNKFQPVVEFAEPVNYLLNRCVPVEILEEIYWCDEPYDKKFCPYGQMIVIPLLRREDGSVYGYSARSITSKDFYVKLLHPDNPKVYNIFNVDNDKDVFIMEGIFDSLSVDNSIACLGASIMPSLLDEIKHPVFLLDCDQTGYNESLQRLKEGYRVVILTRKDMRNCKDINELVVNYKLSKNDIKRMLINRIYEPNASSIMKLTNLIIKNKWVINPNKNN